MHTILAVILLVFTGCGENKQSDDDLKSYPKRVLILQNLMDVEYITLETTDEFLTQENTPHPFDSLFLKDPHTTLKLKKALLLQNIITFLTKEYRTTRVIRHYFYV